MLFCDCSPEAKQHGFERARAVYKLNKLTRLPAVLGEASGVVVQPRGQSILSHNDGGGRPTLYESDWRGQLLDSLSLSGATNTDWEDLTQDTNGNLFVGDFGNNTNMRKDLTIYKVNRRGPAPSQVQTIRFRYAAQRTFPPDRLVYDCEAFFWYQDSLYLFSKNRGADRYVRLYRLPATPGDYVLSATDSIALNGQVTGAAISPNGEHFALLTYGKVLVFGLTEGRVSMKSPRFCIKMSRKQTEAIGFLNNTDMLITNEQRNVYTLRRKN